MSISTFGIQQDWCLKVKNPILPVKHIKTPSIAGYGRLRQQKWNPCRYHVALSNCFQQWAAFRIAAERIERERRRGQSSHTLYLERIFESRWLGDNHMSKMELSCSRHDSLAPLVASRRKGRRLEGGREGKRTGQPPMALSSHPHSIPWAEAAGSQTGLSRTVTSLVQLPIQQKAASRSQTLAKGSSAGKPAHWRAISTTSPILATQRGTWGVLLSRYNHPPRGTTKHKMQLCLWSSGCSYLLTDHAPTCPKAAFSAIMKLFVPLHFCKLLSSIWSPGRHYFAYPLSIRTST